MVNINKAGLSVSFGMAFILASGVARTPVKDRSVENARVFDFKALSCVDSQGKQVEYVEQSFATLQEEGVWFAKATLRAGKPSIEYETEFLGATAPAHRAFVMAHECAHQQEGDLYVPLEAGTENLRLHENETEMRIELKADCVAVEILVYEQGYGQDDIDLIKSNARTFFNYLVETRPELGAFFERRLDNIQQCYEDFAPK